MTETWVEDRPARSSAFLAHMLMIQNPTLSERLSVFSDRNFKYLMIAPAILILLLVGLFPLI